MTVAKPKNMLQLVPTFCSSLRCGFPFRRTVRDAALDCLQELYRALGATLLDNLRRQSIRPAALREVAARLDQVRFGLIP